VDKKNDSKLFFTIISAINKALFHFVVKATLGKQTLIFCLDYNTLHIERGNT